MPQSSDVSHLEAWFSKGFLACFDKMHRWKLIKSESLSSSNKDKMKDYQFMSKRSLTVVVTCLYAVKKAMTRVYYINT